MAGGRVGRYSNWRFRGTVMLNILVAGLVLSNWVKYSISP
jgi:hypothetical protein